MLGQGSEEFGRVLRGVVLSTVVVGLVGLALEMNAVRPWVFAIIPAIGVATELVRYALRRMVHRRRAQGRCMLTAASGTLLSCGKCASGGPRAGTKATTTAWTP